MDAPDSPSIDAKPKLVDGKIVWSGGPSLKQRFSLPYSIMYYMAKNPSSAEVYNKLIQSCKYFFEKNPILVAADLFDETTLCTNPQCDGFKDDNKKCCVEIDMKKLSSGIWLTNKLYLSKRNVSIFSPLIYPRLFRWESVMFNSYCTAVKYNDFKSFSSLLTDIDLHNVRITQDDGKTVMLEEILEMVPNVKTFEYSFLDDFSMITASSMKNNNKLKNLHHLESFTLRGLSDVLDIEDISTFLKNHRDTKIMFFFRYPISEEYKIQLNTLIDTVIKAKLPPHFIIYDGQNKEKYKIMCDRYHV